MKRRILVVEDFEPFRQWVCSTLRQRAEFQVTDVSDGLEALRKAEELQPDLILLDLGLPKRDGLEVARRVREVAPATKILFLSQESSSDVVRTALDLGALGYVHKPRAHSDLLLAVDTVFGGRPFVSSNLEFPVGRVHRHEVIFCTNDDVLLEGLTRFIAAALKAGNAAIVWTTESHRDALLQRLRADGVDVDTAIQRGVFISADVAEPPDRARMLQTVRGLSEAALKAGKAHPRVAVCGERAGRLWAEGKTDVAIGLERLLNELAKSQAIDILCPYPFLDSGEDDALRTICAEHSGVSLR